MADPLSYNQLLEKGKEIEELLQSQVDKEEKEELEYIWNCIKSREESKFDAIISVIKDCDKQISSREKEIIELKRNQNYWKTKRKNIINIIKKAYEEQLIDSMPTGNKYEATIRRVKSKLIDSNAIIGNISNYKDITPESAQRLDLKDVSNTNTGVFIGSCNTEYFNNQSEDPSLCNEYSITGGLLTLLSNRISYFYNLKGPSMTIDTACSSSGYALQTTYASGSPS